MSLLKRILGRAGEAGAAPLPGATILSGNAAAPQPEPEDAGRPGGGRPEAAGEADAADCYSKEDPTISFGETNRAGGSVDGSCGESLEDAGDTPPASSPSKGAFGEDSFEYDVGCWSARGPRHRNEDACRFESGAGTCYAALSDGIGGASYGEVYSKVAVAAAMDAMKGGAGPREAVDLANGEVCRLRDIIDAGGGGGATLLCCAYSPAGEVDCAWVGDSLLQIVRADGTLDASSYADRVAGSNVLASALGIEVPPRFGTFCLAPGDAAVMSTDGVWEHYGEAAADLVLGKTALAAAFDLAEGAGRDGRDNSTAIVVRALPLDGPRGRSRLGELVPPSRDDASGQLPVFPPKPEGRLGRQCS